MFALLLGISLPRLAPLPCGEAALLKIDANQAQISFIDPDSKEVVSEITAATVPQLMQRLNRLEGLSSGTGKLSQLEKTIHTLETGSDQNSQNVLPSCTSQDLYVRGPEADAADDSIAYATCPDGYLLVGCSTIGDSEDGVLTTLSGSQNMRLGMGVAENACVAQSDLRPAKGAVPKATCSKNYTSTEVVRTF